MEKFSKSLDILKKEGSDFVERLDGKTVITSDYGGMFAERPFLLGKKIYRHPPGLRTDQLCIVPYGV